MSSLHHLLYILQELFLHFHTYRPIGAIWHTDLLFIPFHPTDIFNVSLDFPRPERDRYGMTEEKKPIRD